MCGIQKSGSSLWNAALNLEKLFTKENPADYIYLIMWGSIEQAHNCFCGKGRNLMFSVIETNSYCKKHLHLISYKAVKLFFSDIVKKY